MTRVIYRNKNTLFFKELKKGVDHYFETKKIKKTGNWRLYIKSLILIPAALFIYLFLLIAHYPAWIGIVLCSLLGFTLASIGFSVMHDALHGSYSSKKWLNNLIGVTTMNALGGSSFFWKQKHNIIHHTYTNIDNVDDDIAKSPMIRMCGTQKWSPLNRLQHFYTPVLYMLSTLFWVLLKDNVLYFKKTASGNRLAKMTGADQWIFWVSRLLYPVFYVVIPILAKGTIPWLIGFLTMHLVMGFVLSIVFQLAHVCEETSFEAASLNSTDTTYIENEWAVHQINTTANFAPGNKILSWFVGGLNFQVEHHLFPRISHIHYPEISKIVQRKCTEFGISYISFRSMSGAVNSHFSFLKELGKKPVLAGA